MDSLFSTSPQSVAGSHLNARLKASKHNDDGIKKESISLTDFVHQLPDVIESSKRLVSEGSVEYGSGNDPITKLFQQVNFSDHEWEPYALFDANRNYTRNLIATDDETFTLLLLCWNPGRHSPIHDHPCDGCWMKVCRGQVQEQRYEYPQGGQENDSKASLACIHDETYMEGQLAYIADWLGFHKVGNPTEKVPAVTMHLYVPPIKVCKIWMTEDCAPSKSCSCNYSEYGCVLK